ncbi:MAG: Cys-tRNA(Pro) deacylase [Micrococcales bacterium]|nr:MAG: Cys-tRNA(Pro) deacylase [Micrococcales bacterium]PIE28013.1 MAG: Cys-tRNA(Pro) deacylase [Micrococcales bacterium]
MGKKKTAATPAMTVLARAGVHFITREYGHDKAAAERAGGFGQEAVLALGVAAQRVFKTLVVELSGGSAAPGQLAVAVLPVPDRLDLKAVATALGAKRAAMADVAKAQRTTGYVAGGISPLGQRTRLPTVIDECAFGHETVLVSGGRRGLDIELDPEDLARLTGGVRARVAEHTGDDGDHVRSRR